MTNEAKILGISLMMMIGLNVLVAPLVQEDGGAGLPSLQPPDDSILSPDFSIEDTEGGTLVPDSIAQAASTFIQYVNGIVTTITWFFTAIGGLLFGGIFAHPLLTVINFILVITSVVAIIKMLPST